MRRRRYAAPGGEAYALGDGVHNVEQVARAACQAVEPGHQRANSEKHSKNHHRSMTFALVGFKPQRVLPTRRGDFKREKHED
jgi:hypothetical protein